MRKSWRGAVGTGRRVIRSSAIALTLAAGLLAASSASSPSASAWEPMSCRGWGGTIDVWVTVNQSPTTSLIAGAEKWDPVSSNVDFEPAATQASRDLWANNKDFGATQWSGLFRDYNNIDALPNCYDNRWSANAMVSINTEYNTNYPARRMGVAVHEFGHYLGLDHEDATASCSGGGTRYLAIMHFSDARFLGNCPVFIPQTDDAIGINALF